MNWFALSVSATVLMTVFEVISKKLVSNHARTDPVAYITTSFLFVALFSLGAVGMEGVEVRGAPVPLIGLVGLMTLAYAGGPILFYRAMSRVALADLIVLTRLRTILIFLAGILLFGESASWIKLAGTLCVLAGSVILVAGEHLDLTRNRYLAYAIASNLFYTVGALADKMLSAEYLSVSFYQFLNFFLPAMMMMVLVPQTASRVVGIIRDRVVLGAVLVNSIFFFLGFNMLFRAYASGGEISRVNVIYSSQTVLIVVLSVILLRERDRWQVKLASGLLVTAGVFLLK
ncbi:MAG TPA: EamA family transporter [bacterium]|nr:EamA family transporter [bacterium]